MVVRLLQVRRYVGTVAAAALFLISPLAVLPASAHLPGDDCDVHPGMSVQAALDAAAENAVVVVCPGIYFESVTVRRSGLTLKGQPGAVLDGSVLAGTNYGVRIQEGVERFTLQGFEIRRFNDPLVAGDLSSGIVAFGGNKNIRIADNYVHHNAWAGLVLGRGSTDHWTVENNRFETNGLAHVLASGGKRIELRTNDLGAAPYGFVLAKTQKVSVVGNTILGGGEAAIAILPALDRRGWSILATVDGNLVQGTWGHGVWALGLQRSAIRNNVVAVTGTGMTLGGDAGQLSLVGNSARPVVETGNVEAAFTALASVVGSSQPQSSSFEERSCRWYSCWLLAVAEWVDSLLPSASAQAPPEVPPPCELFPAAPCGPTLEGLLYDLTQEAMNPGAAPGSADYYARLDACTGQPDDCLRSQFIQSGDPGPSHAWSVFVNNDPVLGNAELRFVDIAVKRATETKGRRLASDPLDQEWTTFVLCRIYVAGVASSCMAAPRLFDFGFDVTWSPSEFAQHASKWRLKLPSTAVHASFDRVHATDATLFHYSSTPHHGESPPPATPGVAQEIPAQDPLRVQYGGSLVLQCQLGPFKPATIPPSGVNEIFETCRQPTLAKELWDPRFYWCRDSLIGLPSPAWKAEAVHATRASEQAAGLWGWSDTCQDLAQPFLSNWTKFFTKGDLEELASAQRLYYQATSQPLRDAAHMLATNVTLRAVGRHLAIRLPGSGMPLALNAASLNLSAQYNATLLEWDTGLRANLLLAGIQNVDRAGVVSTSLPGLVAFTPARIAVQVKYRHLNGDLLDATLLFTLAGENATLTAPPQLVNYAGRTFGNVVSRDPDNRDYNTLFGGNSTRVHTYPLVEASVGGKRVGTGLLDSGFEVAPGTTEVRVCRRELWTARSDGTQTNVPVGRLGIQVDAEAGSLCKLFSQLKAVNLRYLSDQRVSLEVRSAPLGTPANVYRASWEIVPKPLLQLARKATPTTLPTLEQAFNAYQATPWERSVETGLISIAIEVSPNLTGTQKADVVAEALNEFSPLVSVFAIGLEDVPMTPALDRALRDAVGKLKAIVLVPAGRLLPSAYTMRVQDKLTTIFGLAGDSRVITIGAGSVAQGVAPWSRLGPSADTMTPKPDFVAPTPVADTLGALYNVLPFALAVAAVGDVDLVRALLAGFAVPVKSQYGGPATFWEQGFGALDLSAFIQLPPLVDDLLNMTAARVGKTRATVLSEAAARLNTTTAAVEAAKPAEVLGAVVPVDPLLRGAMTAALVNVVVDSPALPANVAVDFGVVNHAKAGRARFVPLDFDSILNASFEYVDRLLKDAGYVGTDFVSVSTLLRGLIRLSAESGQRITLNATHYWFNETLRNDFLYSAYGGLLDEALKHDEGASGVDWTKRTETKIQINPWLLKPYYLVNERRGNTRLPILPGCPQVPLNGLLNAGDAAIATLVNQDLALDKTSKGLLSTEAVAGLTQKGRDAVAGVTPTSRDFITPGTGSFVQSQASQLLCLKDAQELLLFLKARAEAMRRVKDLPWGALNATEARLGTYDKTLLGGEVGNALTSLGINPTQAAGQNSTFVIDATIELLSRALQLLADHLKLPLVDVFNPVGPNDMVTNPAKTRTSPLGLYVGLATMTSHNVTVRNPLTGQVVAKRNVTIPVPSTLWNNPTLVVDGAYRDTSPLAFTKVLMHVPQTRVFDRITETHHVVQDGVIVPLLVDESFLLKHEIRNITWLLAQVNATIASTCAGTAPVMGVVTQLCDSLKPLRDQLVQRLLALRSALRTPDVSLGTDLTLSVGPFYEELVGSLVSRLKYQTNATDANGRAALPNLFPGSYNLFMPYPYPMEVRMGKDYPPIGAGQDALAGPILEPEFDLSRELHDFENALPLHPTAEPVTDGSPAALESANRTCSATTTNCDYLPFFEVNGQKYGPFHRFNLTVKGVELAGVSCLYTRQFAMVTGTPLRFRGCNLPILDGPLLESLKALGELAECLLGERANVSDEQDTQACKNQLDATASVFARAGPECDAPPGSPAAANADWDACAQKRSLEELFRALQNVTSVVSLLLGPGNLLFPWMHSPARLLLKDKDYYGFTSPRLFALASSHPGNVGKTSAQIEAAVDSVLATLGNVANDTVKIEQPKLTSTLKVTHPQGIVHHVTDKVTGLDWFHFDLSTSSPITASTAPKDQVQTAAGMVLNIPDKGNVTAFGIEVTRLGNTSREAYNAGLTPSLLQKLDQRLIPSRWAPNGTVTRQGLTMSGQTAAAPKAPLEVCNYWSGTSGLPPAYFDCPTRQFSGKTAPLVGVGGVDNFQFTNALLDQFRSFPEYANLPEPTKTEKIKQMLTRAVALSTTSPDQSWYRTTDAIRVQPTGALPMLGVMMYSTPVPVNEYVQLRFQADILAKNTGLIIVTTGKATAAEQLLRAVGKLPPPNDIRNLAATDPAAAAKDPMGTIGTAANGTLAVAHKLAEILDTLAQKDPYLRVDAIGLPVAWEQRFNPDIGITEHCIVCERGMVLVQPDGYYQYRKTHEFETKPLASTLGIETLYTMLIYFPTLLPTQNANPSAPVDQKLVISNATIQLSTFLGLANDNPNDPQQQGRITNVFSSQFRIGFKPTVEDWKMFYAVPDQKPRGTNPAPDASLTVYINATGGRQFVPGPENMLRVAEPRSYASWCPDTVAPGYDTRTFEKLPRAVPADLDDGYSHMYLASSNRCKTDEIYGLRPVHVEFRRPITSWTTSAPSKDVQDVLNYVFNTGTLPDVDVLNTGALPGEDFTKWGKLPAGYKCGYFCKGPLYQVGGGGGIRLQNLANLPAMNDVGKDALNAAYGVTDFLTSRSVLIDASKMCKCIYQSFIPGAQHGQEGSSLAGPTITNYVVMDEAMARFLMNGSYDSSKPISVWDRSDPTKANQPWVASRTPVEAQRLLPKTDTDYRGLIVAHEFEAHAKQSDPPHSDAEALQTFVEEASLLVAHGVAGTGIALKVVTEQKNAGAVDHDTSSFVRGLNAPGFAQVTVSFYRLGGGKVAGSACKNVPLYDYVRPYFRCNGYDYAAAGIVLAANAGPTGCYDQALKFVKVSQNESLDHAENFTPSVFYAAQPVEDLVASLAQTNPLIPSTTDLSGRVQGLVQAQNVSRGFMENATALLNCLRSIGAISRTVGVGGDFRNFMNQAQGAIQKAKNDAEDVAAPLINLINETHPGLLQFGEPQRDTVAKLLIPDQVRSAQLLGEVGAYPVPYAVEEWSSRVVRGWLNVTDTPPSGAPSTSTLTTVSGSVVGSALQTLAQGHHYRFNLTVVDEYGRRTWDEVAFKADGKAPDLSGLPAPLRPFMNGLAVGFTARDETTGVSAARIELSSNDGATWTVLGATVTPTLPAPEATVQASLDATQLGSYEGKKIRIRFVAEDGAGNRNGTSAYDFDYTNEGFTRSDAPLTVIDWNASTGRVDYNVHPAGAQAEYFGRSLGAALTPAASFEVTSKWHVTSCGQTAAAYPIVLKSTTASKLWVRIAGGCQGYSVMRLMTNDGTIRSTPTFAVLEGGTYAFRAAYSAATKRLDMSVAGPSGAALAASSYVVGGFNPDFRFDWVGAAGGNNGPDGPTGTCYTCANAVGWVDNVIVRRESESFTSVDVTPPTVVGSFLGSETISGVSLPVITKASVDATATATDGGVSGFERVILYLRNATTQTLQRWYDSQPLNGGSVHGPDPTALKPMLDATYSVIGYAKDRAGNVFNQTLASAEVRIRPSVDLEAPPFIVQSAGYLKIRATATISGYPLASADESWIRVLNGNTALLNVTVPGATTPAAATWDAAGVAKGNYTLRFDSFRRGVKNQTSAQVEVLPLEYGARRLEREYHYDHLATTDAADMFRLRLPNCYSGFRVTLTTEEGGTTTMSAKELTGSQLSASTPVEDPGFATVSDTYEVRGKLPGDVYALRVNLDSGQPASYYRLRVQYLDSVCPGVA